MRNFKIKLIILTFCAFPLFGDAQNNWESIGDNGITWSAGVNDMYVDTVTDLLYIAGRVSYAGSVCSPGILAWDGTNFLPLGCGIDWNCQGQYQSAGPPIYSITKYNNEIYVGGTFTSASGVACNNIARWNGTSWDSVGSGVNYAPFGMREINGELYVVGAMTVAGGIPVNGIAKWNGSNWSAVNAFPNYGGNILDDVIEYNGELYVCGNFTGSGGCREIVKWDGTNWVSVGGGVYGSTAFIETMCIFQNKLYVAGYFIKSQDINNPGNFVAAWDGTSWSDPGGGTFDISSPLNNGQIHDLKVYHNELWAVGAFHFAGGVPGYDVAKWDGTQWCTFDSTNALDNRPLCLEVYHDSLIIGGGFWTINGDSMQNIAKWGGGSYVDTCGYFYLGVTDPLTPIQTVTVFPNPASENSTFKFTGIDGNKTVVIYDQLGKEIWRKETDENQIEFPAENYAAGLYYYQVLNSTGKIAAGKLVIE